MAKPKPIKRRERAECALTYALWDAENTVKLQTPGEFETYHAKALEVLRWLRVHGATVNVR